MKTVLFAVDSGRSYVKAWRDPPVKPGVAAPLVMPLAPGGTLTLRMDEGEHRVQGEASGLRFVTDRFNEDPSRQITGMLQSFTVKLHDLALSFAPGTGVIQDGGGYMFVVPEPSQGGSGSLAANHLGPSALLDGNSPGFDLSNGLGCKGGVALELGYSGAAWHPGDPPDFLVHLEGAVSKEDVDGDGTLEVVCPPQLGIPVSIGGLDQVVTFLFGVTNGGAGIGILPNGHVVHIPPRGGDPVLTRVAEGLSELVRGLALRTLGSDAAQAATRATAARLGLDTAARGLEVALDAVRKELGAGERKDR